MSSETPNLDWFDVTEYENGVVGIAEPGHIEDVKAYLVLGSEQSLMVDTGLGFANIRSVVDQYASGPVLMVNTHGHLDHIGDNWRFERRWIHSADVDRVRSGVSHQQLARFLTPEAFSREPPPGLDLETYLIPGIEVERTVEGGEVIDLGDRTFEILYTPGHTPGCICFYEASTGILICGDIVHEGALFAHYPGGSAHEYRDTLRLLNERVPDLSIVYPGHSRYPIEPQVVRDVHLAMEEIWNGREPDEQEDGLLRFQFNPFSFTLRESWQDEAS